MNPSPSSLARSSVTTLDESSSHPVKSTFQSVPNISAEFSPQPQPDAPPSFQQPPAPPTPLPDNSVDSSTSMPLVQSSPQPNYSSQSLNTPAASLHSSSSCLSPPLAESVSSSGSRSATAPPQQPDSEITSPDSFPTKSQRYVTHSFSFPGAPASASTFDSMFQVSADSQYLLTPSSSAGVISDDSSSQRTPNVYINGLPPNFSEQDLFALTRPFGDIKSVRTFTRHVSEKPTGYGFVLFGDVTSAQKCIEGLRKYRNLHPSFSKQVHRIPGTEYAQHNTAQSSENEEHSFKARMEKLKDTASTNLYIEGLPLSIDEESLAALVLPYKIKSSRFFKTKLSNPPRIIAFLRLESRAAAEETIERLHGRMVRGWKDPGCRISVRFADSAEQRELRRAERSLKNGDQSPSRLTIAQAALLNLRGQEFQPNVRHVAGGQSQRSAHVQRTRSDTPVTSNRIPAPGMLPTSLSLPSKLYHAYEDSPFLPTASLPITSDMDTLIQSIQNMGYDDGSVDTMRSTAIENEYLLAQQAQLQSLANAALVSSNVLRRTLPRGQTQARNGFTHTENLILDAHSQRLQLQAQVPRPSPIFQQLASPRGFNANIRTFEAAALESFQQSPHAGRAMLSEEASPFNLEDEFHAMGHFPRHFAPLSHELRGSNGYPPIGTGAPSTMFVRPPSRAVSIVPPPADCEEHAKRSKGQQRSEPSIESKRTSNHLFPHNNRRSNTTGDHKAADMSHLQAPTHHNHNHNSSNSNPSALSGDQNIEQHDYSYPRRNIRGHVDDDNGARLRSLPSFQAHANKSPALSGPGKEGPKSPAAVSPALTYCSRTPSTLSPATPFFGSFTGNQDTFDVVTMDNEDAVERKLKAKGVSK